MRSLYFGNCGNGGQNFPGELLYELLMTRVIALLFPYKTMNDLNLYQYTIYSIEVKKAYKEVL